MGDCRQTDGEAGEQDTSKDQPLRESEHSPAPVPVKKDIIFYFRKLSGRDKEAGNCEAGNRGLGVGI
jgi:hypothetical protein